MKKNHIIIVASFINLFFGMNIFAQIQLQENQDSFLLDDFDCNKLMKEYEKSKLIFYGFIHGGEAPQLIETQILEQLIKSKGVRHFAPEVSYSQAYFLNLYLNSGNEEYLEYVLQSYHAPQDASVALMNKFRKLYEVNKSVDDKIKIVGTDTETNLAIIVAHLARLHNSRMTDLPVLDSLKFYTKIDEPVLYKKSNSLWKFAWKRGLTFENIIYSNKSIYNFSARLMKSYNANPSKILNQFESDSTEAKQILEQYRWKNREDYLVANFESEILPLIKADHIVFSTFGYAHVLQEKFNKKMYLAGALKKKYPNLGIHTTLVLMGNGEVLLDPKLCIKRKVKKRGITIKLAELCGSKTSAKWDGDTPREKIKGIDTLKGDSNWEGSMVINLREVDKNKLKNQYYIGYERGKNADKIQLDPTKSTIDYYQSLIYVNGSNANIPFELSN